MGYIGANIAFAFLKEGKEVILLDYQKDEKILEELSMRFSTQIKYYCSDMLKIEEIKKVFEENREIEAVIHCAGYKMNTIAQTDIAKYYTNNITTTLLLLEAMKEYHVKRLIFNSSASVYEKSVSEMVKEDQSIEIPSHPYGRSKVYIEQILKQMAEKEEGWKIDVIRIFNPIGICENIPKESGKILLKKAGNLMANIVKVAIGEKEKLEIYVEKKQELKTVGVRDYIAMSDLVMSYKKLLNEESHFEEGIRTYNIGTGRKYSIMELVKIFENIVGKKIPYDIIEKQKVGNGIKISCADIEKIKRQIKWQPEEELEKTCENMWKYFKG